MSRKQESSFGVVARTGFSLLALGFGSALFGALVVGPMLGKQMGRDPRSSARTPGTETRLASNTTGEGASRSAAPAAEEPQRDAEPKQDDKAESTAQFAEGPGSEAVPPPSTSSYSGPTEDPDATSSDAGSSADDTDTPRATVRSEPFSKPEPVKIEAPKPAKIVVEAPAEPEAAKPSVRSKRDETEGPSGRRDEDRQAARDAGREAERRREARAHRAEEPSRDLKSDRRDDSAPAREERKPSRDRVTEEPKRGRTRDQDTERASARVLTVKKSDKTEAAKAPDVKSDTDTERAAEEAKLYRVRVGRVHPREEAEKLRDELKDTTGVDAFLVPVGDGFQIQTGAYKRKANADKIAATLRAGNFKTVVRQDP